MAERNTPTPPAPSQAREPTQQPRAGERPSASTTPDETSPHARRRRIEEGAYYRSERRGFAPGSDLDDWYAAEAEEDARDSKVADRAQDEGAR